MSKKLNPKLEEALGDYVYYARGYTALSRKALLDRIEEMLVEMGVTVFRGTGESDGLPPEPKMMRVIAQSILYSGGENDE